MLKIFKLTIIVLVLIVSLARDLIAQSSPTAELTWKNGDKIPGQMISASESKIVWAATNLFRDPLSIDWRYLQSINFSTENAAKKTTEVFSVHTIDGNSLFGEIQSLDEERLVITSDRLGTVNIPRARIASVLHLKNSGSLLGGSIDLEKWSADRGQRKNWTIDEQGHLVATQTNTHLYLKTDLPESALIELELQWDRKLDFIFGFGVPDNSRRIGGLPRLETWEDSLVLNYGDDFEIVKESFDVTEKTIRLLIHWDRLNHQLVIHDSQGQPLATADLGASSKQFSSGVFLENKSGDLVISKLAIRNSAPGFNATEPSIQQLDRPSINGTLESFDGENWTVSMNETETEDEQSTPTRIPTDEFCGAFLINGAVKRLPGLTHVHFADGMFMCGEFLSFASGRMAIQPTGSTTPISLALEGATKISLATETPPSGESFTHQLINSAGSLRGRLESKESDSSDSNSNVTSKGDSALNADLAASPLGWRISGADKAVPFGSANAKVILQKKTKNVSVDERWPDTLYLKNRDTIPCRVISVSETELVIDSFIERDRLPVSLVKAIDFGKQKPPERILTADGGWQIPDDLQRKLIVTGAGFAGNAGCHFSHSWLMSSGGFEFDLKWSRGSYGVVDLQLLTDTEAAEKTGASIKIFLADNTISVVDNLNNAVNGTEQGQEVNRRSAKIRVRASGDMVKIWVDGVANYEKKLNPNQRAGRGVKFELQDYYQQAYRAELTNFRLIYPENGNATLIDPVRRDLLLTIPRLKQKQPPGQIVCANNGDLLRGNLVDLDDQFVRVESDGEEQRFPREIISSIVWLDSPANLSIDPNPNPSNDLNPNPKPFPNPDAEKFAKNPQLSDKANAQNNATALSSPTVQILMQGNRRMSAVLKSWADGKLLGESSALGRCDIPFDEIYELRFGSYATAATDVAYTDWNLKFAPQPKMDAGADGQDGTEMLFGSSSPLIGTSPKPFVCTMLDDTKLSSNDFGDRVIVLDFWATWCGPCVQALPELIETVEQYDSNDVLLIGVNQAEAQETIEQFLKSREFDFSVAMDAGSIGEKFDVEALPTTIILDREGKIAFVNLGHTANLREKLKSAIDSLLID